MLEDSHNGKEPVSLLDLRLKYHKDCNQVFNLVLSRYTHAL